MFKQIILLIVISLITLSTVTLSAGDISYKARFSNETVCIDDSINQNHGTYTNINFSSGIINGAAVFNGDNSYITIPQHNSLTFSDGVSDLPFSISFWINILEPNEVNPIFTKGYTTSLIEYEISTEEDIPKGNIVLYDQVSGYTISCVTQDTLIEYETCNGWLHVIITYDGSSTATGINMYFNGEFVLCDRHQHPSYTCMTPQVSNSYIGREYQGMGYASLEAMLDEVIIYNEEIPAFKVSAIYNEYICSGYTLTLIKKNNIIGDEGNITVYRNGKYYDTVSYEESFYINNTYDYSFLIHEDITDTLTNVNNIEQLSNTGLSYFVYAVIVIGILALLMYLFRRF